MVDLGQLIGAVGGVGGTAAVISVAYMFKDHREKEREQAVSEGRHMEQQAAMKIQIDSAHDKLRTLDRRYNEMSVWLSDLKNDVKWIVQGVGRLEEKFDKHESDGR